MSAALHILSIDLGTSGPKIALVSEDGGLAATATGTVETTLLPGHGAEQDPEEIWAAVRSGVRQVLGAASVRPDDIAAVTLASQYFSTVPVDREGRPLANLLLWMDRRGAEYARAISAGSPEAMLRWLEVHGIPPLPSGGDSLSHMLWFQHRRPEIYERTFCFLEPGDFIAARLTGVCAANPCTAFTTLLTDNRCIDAIDYDPELVAMSGIDHDKLPPLVPVHTDLGPLRAPIAAELGLSVRTRVFSGTNDTQAVAVGTGTFRGARGALNIGTTSQVLAHLDRKQTDLENEIVSMPSPIPGRYVAMAENGLGAKTLDHFLRQIAFARDALADHSSADPFAGIEAAAAAAPPGSGGLIFLPWLAGSQSPRGNSSMRGGFLNLSLETTRVHMVRAILEGVAYSLRWLLPAVERFTDSHFADLRFAGGAALSEEWSQILADVLDRPVLQLEHSPHVINRAVAFLGFAQLGRVSLDDIDRICPVRRVFEPRPGTRDIYDRLFEQFLRAFEQNRPIYEALNGPPTGF